MAPTNYRTLAYNIFYQYNHKSDDLSHAEHCRKTGLGMRQSRGCLSMQCGPAFVLPAQQELHFFQPVSVLPKVTNSFVHAYNSHSTRLVLHFIEKFASRNNFGCFPEPPFSPVQFYSRPGDHANTEKQFWSHNKPDESVNISQNRLRKAIEVLANQ